MSITNTGLIDPRLSLWFDFDETMAVVTLKEGDSNILNNEAMKHLSASSIGIIKNPVLFNVNGGEGRAFEIKAIARQRFDEVFNNIAEINKFLGQKVISVNIITNGTYTKNEVIDVLNVFFGNIQISHFANRSRENPSKGGHIEACQSKSQSPIPKGRTYLIDDSEKNCNDAEKHGFKAIRMHTSLASAPVADYAASMNESFDKLNKIIENTKSLGMQRRLQKELQSSTLYTDECECTLF